MRCQGLYIFIHSIGLLLLKIALIPLRVLEDVSEDILTTTKKSTEDLLPAKSKAVYERVFQTFVDWKLDNDVTVVDETVMLTYFKELVCYYLRMSLYMSLFNFVPVFQSEKYTPNSMWSKYSILKSTLIAKDNVDISSYNRLLTFLKQKSKGYTPKKSKVLTGDQVLMFLKEACNDTYLMHKVKKLRIIYLCCVFLRECIVSGSCGDGCFWWFEKGGNG